MWQTTVTCVFYLINVQYVRTHTAESQWCDSQLIRVAGYQSAILGNGHSFAPPPPPPPPLPPPLLCFHKLTNPMPGSQGLNPNWQALGWCFETWLTELASFLRLRHKLILLILQFCCHVQRLSIFKRLLIWEIAAGVPCWKWKESVFITKSMWLWYKDDTP